MKKSLVFSLLLITLLLSPFQVRGQGQPELFQAETFVAANGDTLLYRILYPENMEEGVEYPLVLFLHGAGERGNDNEAQLKWGVLNFAEEGFRQKHPAIVIAPQAPEQEYWANPVWRTEGTALLDQPTPSLAATYELMNTIIEANPVDENRIYITGLSMGGFGTWDMISRYPGLFAAAVPICAGGDVSNAHLLKDLPIWAFHGAHDEVVLPKYSRDMIDAIREAGGLPGYTEYPDVGHDSWIPAYDDLYMLEWMFSQVKSEESQ